jgi:DNA-binding MarR family transcriptional regulator
MKRIDRIGTLLKKIYRTYSADVLSRLSERGFNDLRSSFLEVLLFICENEGAAIKQIGDACALKKQTMTSHLNELERRGYVVRKISLRDRREQCVFLTEHGNKFRLSFFEVIELVDDLYREKVGEVELVRIEDALSFAFERLSMANLKQDLPKIDFELMPLL